MSRLATDTLEAIKAAVTCRQVADHERLPFDSRARRFYCPACQDPATAKDGDLGFTPDERGFRCHKCGESGSCVDLLMLIRGCDAAEAIRAIRDIAGLSNGRHAAGNGAKPPPPPAKPAKIVARCRDLDEARRSLTKAAGPITTEYLYGTDLIVTRHQCADGTKHFRQASRNPDGTWIAGAGALDRFGDRRPLYNLHAIRAAEPGTFAILGEGEKATDAGIAHGLLATTNIGGSSAVDKTDWSPLDRLEVAVIPDADEAGRKHRLAVLRALAQQAPNAIVRDVPPFAELGPKADLADFFEQGGTVHELIARIEAAPIVDLSSYRDGVVLVRACDVVDQPAQFLDAERTIPVESLTLLTGDAGAAKTTFAVGALGTMVTRGLTSIIDDDAQRVAAGDCIVHTSENRHADLASIIRRNGGDLTRLHITSGIRRNGELGHLQVLRDLPDLADAIRRLPNPRLLLIDPLSSELAGVDSWKDADVRGALDPLIRFAQDLRIAVVCVMHLNKAEKASSQYRVMGSIGFTASARSVLRIDLDANEPARRLVRHVKNNLGPLGPTLGFRFAGDGSLRFEPDYVSEADIREATASKKERPPSLRSQISMWLTRQLVPGSPTLARDLIARAIDAFGCSEKTVRRAAEEARIVEESIPDETNAIQKYWRISRED